jgi:DivIVA domain-containing protein
MAEDFSPGDISNARFSTSPLGYKREEVEAFLNRVADAYERALQERLELQMRADKPYQALGEDAGHLLQSAKEQAVELKRQSEAAARKIRDDARRDADRSKVGAERLVRQAQEEAMSLREEAQQDAERVKGDALKHAELAREDADAYAERIKGRADELLRRAQHDATLFTGDAHANARQLKREVETYAAQIKAVAEEETARTVREAEWTVRRLQSMEIALRQRLQDLELQVRSLAGDAAPSMLEDGDVAPGVLVGPASPRPAEEVTASPSSRG